MRPIKEKSKKERMHQLPASEKKACHNYNTPMTIKR